MPADPITMSEVAKWIAPAVTGWLFGQATGDDSGGGYTPEQKHLVESQAQMAELMAQSMADR